MLYKKRCRKLKKYAREFCDTVRRDFSRLPLTKDYPAIIFYRQLTCAPAETPGLEIAERTGDGRPIIDGYYSGGVVEVYGVTKREPAELREIMRHECLHFLLEKSGLPYKDDDDIFLLLAIKYSARPYMIAMNPEKWGFEL